MQVRPTDDRAAASGQHEIRLLGPFTVLRDGNPLAEQELGSRKARTLLKRLLVERGRVVSVAALADALWPERMVDQPERHVATLVSRLRSSLGSDVVVRAGEGYRFGGGWAHQVDVDEAERLASEAEARLAAGEPGLARSAADRALELLDRGDLLADEPDAEWAGPARASVAVLLRRARRSAWAAALSVRDLDVAARVAEAALAAEPLNEEACRALMRAHHARGEPGSALAAFERLRMVLADELGADPAEETSALHVAILRGETAPPPAAPPPAAPATPPAGQRDPGIVGRDIEVEWLSQAWARATAGTAGLVLLVGEAGIGKTRLATEVIRLAEMTGGIAAWARCYEAERSLFLQPVADALRPVVASSSPQLVRAAAGDAAGSLAELIAEVGAAVQLADYRRASPEVERRRVFEAVAGFVRGLAGHRPLLLYLDDVHLAGSSTLELMHFLARRVAGSRVLFLATVRAEERVEVIDTLGEIADQWELGPLPENAVRELARRSGMADLTAQIMAQTRGHSLFVVETLRSLAEQPAGTGDVLVPETLRTAVVARMHRAGPQVEELLQAAATLGSSVDPTVVAALLGESVEETARRAKAASQARLLDEAGAAYEFANDLIREIAYQSTPLPVRIARHRRAADLLTENPEAVAGHAARASEWARAVDAYLQAADAAARRYANRDAERLLEHALRAALRADDPAGVARSRLARGRIREVLTDYQGAYEDHSAVAELARLHGRADLELAALRQLGGDVLVGMRRPSRECIPYLERALQLAELIGDVPGRVDILGRLAVLWTNRLRFDLAQAYADEAVALADPSLGESVRGVALDAVKTTLAYRGDLTGLEELLPQLEICLSRTGQAQRLAWTLLESAFPALARARWPDAAARIERALAISRESGYVAYQSPCLAHLAWVARARGDYGAALRCGRQAADLASNTGHPWWVALAESMLGWTLIEIGAMDEATARLKRGLLATDRDATEAYAVRCLAHLAWASWHSGEHDRAAELAARAEALLGKATGAVFLHGADAALATATVRVAMGELAAARRLLEPIRAAAAEAGWVEAVAWADLLAARCHAAGDPQRAVRHAGDALALAERSELPGIAWQAHAVLAGLLGPNSGGSHRSDARIIIDRLASTLDDARLVGTYRAWNEEQLLLLAAPTAPP